jgi:hypothetical protein
MQNPSMQQHILITATAAMEEINTQNITKLNHVLHIQYVYTEIAT